MKIMMIRIEQAATLPDEEPQWMVLVNGVQAGGMYDKSGAGNRTFESEEQARKWITEILHDCPFTWEN